MKGARSASILLIYPPSKGVTVMPPLGVGYLAGALARRGIRVQVVDMCRGDRNWSSVNELLRRERTDFIGLSVSTPNYLPAKRIASMLKDSGTEAKFLLGGPHASALKARALADFQADVLFVGEAEESLIEYVDAVSNGRSLENIAGLVFQSEGEIVETTHVDFNQDLDTLPLPLWNQIDPGAYPAVPHQLFVRKLPVAPILTTRGCPFNCYFCSSTRLYGSTLRKRSPECVVEEMAMLERDFSVREFHMEDDCLTLDHRHITKLCELLIARSEPLTWKTPNGLSVNSLDRGVLTLMRRAGCYQISLGIETLSQRSINEMGKRYHASKLKEVIREANGIGLEIQGLFIIGLPSEKNEDIQETIRKAPALGLDLAHFAIFSTLPGSEYGDKVFAGEEDFSNINFFTSRSGSSEKRKRVKSLQRKAILRFYLRWKPLRLMLKMAKWKQIPGILNVAKRYLLG